MFDCCKRLTKKKKYTEIKKKNIYFSPYADIHTYNKCNCDRDGPPVIGTCDICGAWKTY